MIPLATLLLSTADREWRREIAPGVEYRTIVQDEPKRTVVALRFAPDAPFRATSSLARDVVYDLTPNNGRATLDEMIATADAVGGVNGDFFQFGDDPGGDPIDLMVRNGELVSLPEGRGKDWRFAYGWGDRGGFRVAKPTWKASVSIGHGVPVTSLNAYTAPKGVTLSTPAAGYAVGKKPTTFLVLNVGPRPLTPRCTVDGTVTQTVEDVERLRVNPGTMVLSTQSDREALRALKPGAKIKIRMAVEGFDWRRVQNAIGGGPVLVHEGKNLGPVDARNPRTAVGLDARGGLVFAVVDGRQALSVGATLQEMGETMKRLGCVEALNLDGGGSSTIAFYGMVLNRPSGGVQRPIANAVLWHGPRPQTASIPLRIVRTSESRLQLVDEAGRPFASDRIVWSAQGKAWVEGDGLLHPLEKGETTVRALVDGRVYEAKLTVEP